VLDCRAWRSTCVRCQQILGRLAAHDTISDGVGVAFVLVTGPSDGTGELHTTALLDHVRCFVRDRVQARSVA
jgi:hypothetical protein